MAPKNRQKNIGTGVLAKKSRTRSKRKPNAANATLTITNGCFAGLKISLKKNRTVLGRDINCDICLDHSFVSEEHAAITRSGSEYILEDLNSRHGTSVNKEEIHCRTLSDGDRIGIGSFELKFCC